MPKLDSQRIAIIRRRLGRASTLVPTNKYLPMFRNRQMRYEAEFNKSVEIAMTKRRPSHYFAKVWSKANLEKSLSWLRGVINRARAKAAELRETLRQRRRQEAVKRAYSPEGVAKIRATGFFDKFGDCRTPSRR